MLWDAYAYGPQNYDNDKKTKFWHFLENEVKVSKQNNVGCLIMFDANSWLGKKILKFDPNIQNENGKLFEDFLSRNDNITLLNSHGHINQSRILKDFWGKKGKKAGS